LNKTNLSYFPYFPFHHFISSVYFNTLFHAFLHLTPKSKATSHRLVHRFISSVYFNTLFHAFLHLTNSCHNSNLYCSTNSNSILENMVGRNIETLLSYHCLTGKHLNTYSFNIIIFFLRFIHNRNFTFVSDRSSTQKPSFRIWQGNQQPTSEVQNIHRRVRLRNCECTFLFVVLYNIYNVVSKIE